MADLKSLNIGDEKSATVVTNYDDILGKIHTAIEDIEENGLSGSKFAGGGSPESSHEHDLVSDAIMAQGTSGPASKALGVVSTAHAESRTGSFPGQASSKFGFLGEGQMKGRASFSNGTGGSSLMPTSYSERKAAAKTANRDAYKASKKAGGKAGPGKDDDVLSSAKGAGISLTGSGSAGHGKPFRMKGMSVTSSTASMVAAGVPIELIQALDSVHTARNANTMSQARLVHGLSEGHQDAELYAANNPAHARQLLNNVTPN